MLILSYQFRARKMKNIQGNRKALQNKMIEIDRVKTSYKDGLVVKFELHTIGSTGSWYWLIELLPTTHASEGGGGENY